MAINYSETITGTMKVVQNFGNEKVTYKFEFRESNCLACIIHVSKNPESISEKDKYIHRLKCFFADTELFNLGAKLPVGKSIPEALKRYAPVNGSYEKHPGQSARLP